MAFRGLTNDKRQLISAVVYVYNFAMWSTEFVCQLFL